MTEQPLQYLQFAQANLQQLCDQLSHNALFVEQNVRPLSSQQLAYRPAPDQWSVQECLSHLILAHASYLPLLEQIAEDTYRPQRPGIEWIPILPRLNGSLLLRANQPGRSWSIPAPSPYLPKLQTDPNVLAKYQSIQQLLLQHLRTIENRRSPNQLQKQTVSSPITRLITLTALDALRIVVAHDTLHLNQAWQVGQVPAFPSV